MSFRAGSKKADMSAARTLDYHTLVGIQYISFGYHMLQANLLLPDGRDGSSILTAE
jgi:hypothetical protein